MQSFSASRFYAACAAAALSSLALCDASFNTTSSLTLTTANLGAQDINITFTTSNPALFGRVNPNSNYGTVGASGYVIFPAGSNSGTNTLNLQVTTSASGTATGFGTAIASATERQSVKFSNSGNTAQTFTVNWSDTLLATAGANDGFANSTSATSGFQSLPTYNWSDGVMAFTPNKLTDNSNKSGSFSVTVAANGNSYVYLTSVSRGFARSFVPAGAPEPSSLAVLGLGSLGVLHGLRRKAREKSRAFGRRATAPDPTATG